MKCTDKDREVERNVRKDKSKWTQEKAEATEKTTENGRSKESDTMMLTGETRRQTVEVKTKHDVLRTEKSDWMERRKEHFSEILNRDCLT